MANVKTKNIRIGYHLATPSHRQAASGSELVVKLSGKKQTKRQFYIKYDICLGACEITSLINSYKCGYCITLSTLIIHK